MNKYNPLSPPDLSDIEVIRGQDHYYWLYSNKLDMYLQTPYACKYMTEEECLELMIESADQYENEWQPYHDTDI